MEVAHRHYFAQDYALVTSFLDSLSTTVVEITGSAVSVKDEALFWVYISEWLVTSSVAIISGATVWTLMIRRRAYRAVGVSRLRPI